MLTLARILKAVLVAVLLDALLFWLGRGTGIVAPGVLLPNVQQPLTLGPVMLASALFLPPFLIGPRIAASGLKKIIPIM